MKIIVCVKQVPDTSGKVAVNPDGTLNRNFYQRLHKTVRRLEPFKEMVKKHVPVLSARTALYFSMTGCVDRNWNGWKNTSRHGFMLMF